jgi:chaperone required for assembly of F1-ATPase
MPNGTEKQWNDIAFYATIATQFQGDEWGELVERAIDGVDMSAYADELESAAIEAFYREG